MRLILALMLAMFAMPAAAPAACHDMAGPAPATTRHAMPMPMPMPMPTTMPGDGQPKAIPPHGCIGCIPPSDWLAARILPPLLAPTLVPHTVPARLDLGGDTLPARRPPRFA
jgi:hypothetical protein